MSTSTHPHTHTPTHPHTHTSTHPHIHTRILTHAYSHTRAQWYTLPGCTKSDAEGLTLSAPLVPGGRTGKGTRGEQRVKGEKRASHPDKERDRTMGGEIFPRACARPTHARGRRTRKYFSQSKYLFSSFFEILDESMRAAVRCALKFFVACCVALHGVAVCRGARVRAEQRTARAGAGAAYHAEQHWKWSRH